MASHRSDGAEAPKAPDDIWTDEYEDVDTYEVTGIKMAGLSLTTEGMDKAREAYRRYQESANDRDLRPRIDQYTARLLGDDWSNFDDIYVGFYALNLLTRRKISEEASENESGRVAPVVNVELDVAFPLVSRRTGFEQTLLDEFLVSDVIVAKQRIAQLIPYRTRLQSFSFGCVRMQFAILGFHSQGVTTGPLGLNSSRLRDSPAWSAVRKRFNCKVDVAAA